MKKVTVQQHHISYKPEVKVVIYKGEYWLLTQLQRRKKVSPGFITALKVWIALHEQDAVWTDELLQDYEEVEK